MRVAFIATALGVATPSAASVLAQSQPTVVREADGRIVVRAFRTTGEIQVDGRLDEAIYAATQPIGDFVQQEPDEFKPATETTEAWVFFDDDTIYVLARCWETAPDRRVANEMRRDTNQLRQSDNFAVLFDTFHDRRNGYLSMSVS